MADPVVHWEIGGRDLKRLAAFYHDLFGWEATTFDRDYRLVSTGDGLGGGLMRCRHDTPAYVTIYVAVDDLEATLAAAEQLGGTPVLGATPIAGVGSFALFEDPEGNTIGILHPTARASS